MKTKTRLLLILSGRDPYVISTENGDKLVTIEEFKRFLQSEGQLPVSSIDDNTDAFIYTDQNAYFIATGVWELFFKSSK